MNEHMQELNRIDAATSPASPAGVVCSGDDAALRESWLLLGQLVEQAQAESEFDEAALLAKISPAIDEPAALPRQYWLREYLPAGALAAGSLAAIALVCLAAAWLIGGRWWDAASGTREKLAGEGTSRPMVVARGNDHSELSWDDSLDERITYVNQVLFHLESGAPRSNESLQLLDAQLEQFGQDIDNSSL